MHNHYIINGAVEFHPATSTLRSLSDPLNIVVLNSPAGRCLLLLIEKNESIVSKNDFLQAVWISRGMQVSTNTFYQNISILRKGLKNVGLSEDLVVTIPRIGLTLSSGTFIKKLTTKNQVQIDCNDAIFIDEQSLDYESKTEKIKNTYLTKPVRLAKNQTRNWLSRFIVPSRLRIRNYSGKIFTGLMFMTSLTLFCALMLLYHGSEGSQYFSSYNLLKNQDGCHIFLSDGISTEDNRIKSLAQNCKKYPWIYITNYPLLPRLSSIRCDKPMTEPNTCISDYFFENE